MLALATTHEGDVPLFLQPLDGNSSGKVSLLAVVMAIQKQLREADGGPSVYVADNGIYSEQNTRQQQVDEEALRHPPASLWGPMN
jgi:transposase